MKIPMTSLGLPAALLAASLFGACSNTARGIQEDTAQNTEKAREASADAKVKTENAGEAAKDGLEKAAEATKSGAEKAAEATKEAAHDTVEATKKASAEAEVKSKDGAAKTGEAVDGATQTMEIKSALIADKSVDATGINVDTNGATKTVTLKGHVPTVAQKTAAERIAKNKAPDYTVVNNLTVG